MSEKWRGWIGAFCLVVGSVSYLVQGWLSPLASTEASKQVAEAAGNLAAMRWALVWDVPLLLIVPAVLFLGVVAGVRSSRVAAIGTGVGFLAMLGTVFLLANDAVVYAAADLADPSQGIPVVEGFQSNGLFAAGLVLYLVGLPVGFVLLAVALWKRRAVPRWAAVALGAFPFVAFVGGDVAGLGLAGGALAVVGFSSCAVALVRSGHGSDATSPLGTTAGVLTEP